MSRQCLRSVVLSPLLEMSKNENFKQRRNGRPSKMTQLHIQKLLRTYFERGIGASVTSEETGINNKTVCKYFDEWSEQISESETVDFLERQKKERERVVVTFDKQILDACKFLDYVNDEIEKCSKENKAIPRHLISSKLEIMKFISSLTERKGSFVMQPIMGEALKKKIEEWMREYGETRSNG